jgi:hypothetical protein
MMFNQLWTLKTRLRQCLLAEMMRHLLRTENDTLRMDCWVAGGFNEGADGSI